MYHSEKSLYSPGNYLLKKYKKLRLSYQIPLITGVAIIATIVINIVAFHYFMGTLFVAYTEEIQEMEQKWSLSPEKLSTILDVSTLSTQKQEEYKEVITELATISTSLKNISDNPELYIQSWSGNIQATEWGYSIQVTNTKKRDNPFANIISLFANPTGWDKDTPEWRLIIGLLTKLLITDLVFLIIITGMYFLWIRRVFNPVNLIINRLNAYIDSARFQSITYTRNDEFSPLVSTINNLHKSLRIQEKIRSNFLSDISHEIRTPITAVKCYLEAIEDGMMPLDNKSMPLLQTELTRLTGITEQIMEYENLTHHYTEDIHVERFALKKQIQSMIHEYLPQIEKNEQQIQVIGELDIFIRMDKNMFVQILHNIFSNFIKYAGNNTILTCSYIRTRDHIKIMFSDTGMGIPEEEINLVKEKFYRVDKSRTRDANNSMGIGLSIIDHIIRIHEWSLIIRNNTPAGLFIQITLPR